MRASFVSRLRSVVVGLSVASVACAEPSAPTLVSAPPASSTMSPPPPFSPSSTAAPSASPGHVDAEPEEATRLRAHLVQEIAKRAPWEGAAWDSRVLDAMRAVPRHRFVIGASLPVAYRDAPLDIGHEQTISQPTVVAIMAQALELEPSSRVLEIGTGSGYHAAVMSLLAAEVASIEIVEALGLAARDRLKKLGYTNVVVRIGDGYAGWPEKAPFDRIVLTAAPPSLPEALVAQLAEGGVLVAPVGPDGGVQRLMRYRKKGGRLAQQDLGAVRFVPMVKAR
jgi:protein-L-isoaspartate(D-aspartate) O-methyltransferase